MIDQHLFELIKAGDQRAIDAEIDQRLQFISDCFGESFHKWPVQSAASALETMWPLLSAAQDMKPFLKGRLAALPSTIERSAGRLVEALAGEVPADQIEWGFECAAEMLTAGDDGHQSDRGNHVGILAGRLAIAMHQNALELRDSGFAADRNRRRRQKITQPLGASVH